MNLNLSASLSIFKLLAKPSLCLPHATVVTFNDLPLALGDLVAEKGKKVNIKAIVLDKDDCFAYPERSEIFEAYKVFLLFLQLLVVSFLAHLIFGICLLLAKNDRNDSRPCVKLTLVADS